MAPSLDARKLARCRQKFLHFFPGGFRDETYLAWERDYKWTAHRAWEEQLGADGLRAHLRAGTHRDAALAAVRVESRTNLLFSFEKMAIRDAVASDAGARAFAQGLYDWLYGPGTEQAKFEAWCAGVASLPRRQTRVATWPVITGFGFVARPRVHAFLKPMVTKVAAAECGYDFHYRSKPGWDTYASYLEFCRLTRKGLADLRPRDMIDIQSFLWVQGSSEYD